MAGFTPGWALGAPNDRVGPSRVKCNPINAILTFLFLLLGFSCAEVDTIDNFIFIENSWHYLRIRNIIIKTLNEKQNFIETSGHYVRIKNRRFVETAIHAPDQVWRVPDSYKQTNRTDFMHRIWSRAELQWKPRKFLSAANTPLPGNYIRYENTAVCRTYRGK